MIALWLLACSGDTGDTGPDLGDPLDWALDDAGPFQVGFHASDLTYTDFAGHDRTIVFNLWYPTLDTEGDGTKYLDIWIDDDVLVGAAPAAPVHTDGYPVHAYSHGYQGFGGTSAFLMRHLASHGWVAVAPDHTHNTLADHEDPLPTAHYVHRPQDMTVVLDHLGADAGALLAGPVDLSRVALSGHSFGSYTTWSSGGATFDVDLITEACESGDWPEGGCTDAELAALTSDTLGDDRVVGLLPLAGDLRRSYFGDTGELSVHVPVVFMGGTEDGPEGQQAQWDAMGEIDFTWISLEGGCHQTFALGQCSTLDEEEGFRIVRTYGLAHSRLTVLGDTSVRGVLDGSEVVGDGVTVQVR